MPLPSGYRGSTRSNATPPLDVHLKRGASIESSHRVHVVVCDSRGRVLMRAGEPDLETFVRSALKPFQALPLLSSGASEAYSCGERGIAVAARLMRNAFPCSGGVPAVVECRVGNRPSPMSDS